FFCTAIVDVSARDTSKDWVVLENCRLIANLANDGDSFHVSVGTKEYLFRLYLVDAPETDEMTPRRLIEQAKYFTITVPQAIDVGRTAKILRRKSCPNRSLYSHICPMRWVRADWNVFMHSLRPKKAIWAS